LASRNSSTVRQGCDYGSQQRHSGSRICGNLLLQQRFGNSRRRTPSDTELPSYQEGTIYDVLLTRRLHRPQIHDRGPPKRNLRNGRTSMRLAYSIGPFLVLIILSSASNVLARPIQGNTPAFVLQTSAQQYVTLLPKVPSSTPSPWLIYPTNSTIWVAGIATGNPPTSQIREFFINQSSKGIVSLPNTIVSSILADPVNPSDKIWFTENSTLAFFDTSNRTQTIETKVITFPNQSIQYLANDTRGRIWMSMVGSSGTSWIAMYNPLSHLTQNYTVPTNGAIIQGISVNPPGDTIWFAEAGSKKIGRLLAETSTFTEYSPPLSVNLSAPIQVAIDTSGDVWFTDHGSDQFGVLDPHVADPEKATWKVFPIGYCPDNCVYGLPNAIFVDSKNTVWFSEHIAGRVGRYDPSTGVLIEYVVPGNSNPLMWWAMPGPNNLVWFVAWASNEIGYVNASLPIGISTSGPASDIVIQRGSTVSIPVQVSSRSSTTLSFGLSPVTQDQSSQFPAQVYGTSPSSMTLADNSRTASFRVSAAWNSTLGPRYIAFSANDSRIVVNAHVRVIVVEAGAPFVALGFSTLIALGGFTFYLRRPRKPKVQSVRKSRR
jgi:streptogramin lyase